MSLHWSIRISVYTVICGAMLAYGLADTTFAQKRGIIAPPESGDQDATDNPRRTRPTGRPASVGNRRGGGATRGGQPGAVDGPIDKDFEAKIYQLA